MSEEKKPRKAVAKKGVTKKPVEQPVAELTAMQAATAAMKRGQTTSKTQSKARAKSLQVNMEDAIRLRAYEIYLQRGATPGNPREDWAVAEREVRAYFEQPDEQQADA